MLKAPFSQKSIETGQLNEKERSLLSQGLLSDIDLQITKILYANNPKANAEFVKSIVDDNLVTLLIKGNETEIIGKEGTTVNALSKELGKKIRIQPLSDRIELTIASLYNIKIINVVERYSSKPYDVPKTVYVKKHELSPEKVKELNNLFTYLYKVKTEVVVVS